MMVLELRDTRRLQENAFWFDVVRSCRFCSVVRVSVSLTFSDGRNRSLLPTWCNKLAEVNLNPHLESWNTKFRGT